MSFRDILVHIPDPGIWPRHYIHAAYCARWFQSHVTGMQVIAPVPMLPVPEAPPVTAALEQQVATLLVQARAGAAPFAERMKTFDVGATEWIVAEGDVVDTLAFAAGAHDLLVLGAVRDSPRSAPQLIARTVIAARKPCLVLPEEARHRKFALDIVAIGWNGSSEALRAIHAALPLLTRAKQVLVLWGQPRDHGTSGVPPFDLDGYLRRHGIAAGRCEVEGDGVEREAGARNADLLVMGAYGRSRFSEWVLGGATRAALWDGVLPLFLHH